jgi:AcrR family transcriptional regulator
MARGSFREQMLKVREDAIVSSVNRFLAEKGFDLMTVDEVAADVGIAKASLYKHFASKEALASAAMVRVLERACEVIGLQAARLEAGALERLREVTRWVNSPRALAVWARKLRNWSIAPDARAPGGRPASSASAATAPARSSTRRVDAVVKAPLMPAAPGWAR